MLSCNWYTVYSSPNSLSSPLFSGTVCVSILELFTSGCSITSCDGRQLTNRMVIKRRQAKIDFFILFSHYRKRAFVRWNLDLFKDRKIVTSINRVTKVNIVWECIAIIG